MKIFVSHSAWDKPLVQALQNLIAGAFVDPIALSYSSASVSDGGIAAGQDWLAWINEQVMSSHMTIVVLTPLSRARPWLMWEAGAVSGAGIERGSSASVVPLLFGIRRDQVPSPLSSRQIKLGAVVGDIADLLESIRRLGGANYRREDRLKAAIEAYISTVERMRIPGMYDVFVSCPMTSIEPAEYEELRQAVDALTREISARGYTFYSALQRIGNDTPDQEEIAAETDFPALLSSRHFLMIYPRRVLSSCLVEAGYALGAGIPSTYFVHDDGDLPYALRGSLASSSNVNRARLNKMRDILDFLTRYPRRIFGD